MYILALAIFGLSRKFLSPPSTEDSNQIAMITLRWNIEYIASRYSEYKFLWYDSNFLLILILLPLAIQLLASTLDFTSSSAICELLYAQNAITSVNVLLVQQLFIVIVACCQFQSALK